MSAVKSKTARHISNKPSWDFVSDDCPYEKQFFSIGQFCQMYQLLPAEARRLAKSAGVEFAMVLNNVPYWDGLAVCKMIKAMREKKETY